MPSSASRILHYVLLWEFVREPQPALRLKPLFEHIRRHSSHKLSVACGAHMAHMSLPQLMRTFDKVAGTTLVEYLNHVRLSSAARLLNETALTIAEIPSEVGFRPELF